MEFKMNKYKYSLLICLHVTNVLSIPLNSMYQNQMLMQSTREQLLQQQLLLVLQQLQNLQMMTEMDLEQKVSPPLMILLPEPPQKETAADNQEIQRIDLLKMNNEVKNYEKVNEDLDSISVEAEPLQEPMPEKVPQKAMLLIPNPGRISIGGIISAIPFLPIEINVPDSISWIYNGIAGIISGIGQRWPIKRPSQQMPEQENSLKMLFKRLTNRNQNVQMPILMLPDVAQIYPMPVQI